ncbi:MAG: FtsX-like permease family protein [Gemmatimonas sp.]|nr:FtsX-like permease family protein [Gemmatimonas sp.]
MRDRLREIDPNLAVADLFTMPDAIDVILAPERAGAVFLSAFGALALLLACVGIYGVVAYAVEQRRREFGIRIALGAPFTALISLVTQGIGLPLALGSVAGLAGALAAGPILRGMLVGVDPGDPITLLTTATILGVAALIATVLPARRAARTDPMEAMRAD